MAHHLSEDNAVEIFLRLPAKYVIRCRAVCTAWRRILTDPDFLAAHSRLWQDELIVYTRLDGPGGPVDIALDTLSIISGDDDTVVRRQQRLICYNSKSLRRPGTCLLLSSCNGVLLFKRSEGSYVLCNPATRQWAELPPLATRRGCVAEYAFYFHETSGEYRLWCHRAAVNISGTWHVLSTGAAQPRNVQVHAEVANRMTDLVAAVPVLLHGRLHWPPPPHYATDIVVLETLSETFQIMAGPPPASAAGNYTVSTVKLFCMQGLLAAADLADEEAMHINVWFLEDYDAGRWECRHRVATPWSNHMDIMRFRSGVFMGDAEGNIMLGKNRCCFKYDARRKTLGIVYSMETLEENVLVSRHVFRENLLQQPYFSARSSSADDDLRLIHQWC